MNPNAAPERYWLPRPDSRAFDGHRSLVSKLTLSGEGIPWLTLPEGIPKWIYLEWLADELGLLFHGSGRDDIDRFEPRTPDDRSPDDFSKQTAVFASGDAIWAMFYAILNRPRPGLRFLNMAVQYLTEGEALTDIYYFFSITREVLEEDPWRVGTLYLLPKDSFVQQPVYEWNGRRVSEPHWASPSPDRPLAKMQIKPADFPFLRQVRGHSNAYIVERSASHPYGFPWLD